MKHFISRFLAIGMAFILVSASALAVTYYSTGSVALGTTTNWNSNRDGVSGSTPTNFTTAGDVFVIQGSGNGGTTPHAMTLAGTLTIGSGSNNTKLQIENGASLTTSAALTIGAAAQFLVDNGGTYTHAHNGGSIPIATWSDGSTCRITGITSATSMTNGSQSFYNFVWNCTGQTGTNNITMNDGTTIRGNFTVTSTGWNGTAGKVRLTSTTGSTPKTINITGNVIVNGATAYVEGTGSGNTGLLTFNVGGDINVSDGYFFVVASSNPYLWNLTGNFLMSGGNVGRGSGAGSVTFTSGNHSFTKTSGTLLSSNSGITWIVASGGSLDMNTSILDVGQFTLNSGATLSCGSSSGISGNLTTSGTKTLSTGANYTFNGSSSQVTSTLLPVTVNNLTISNANGVTLSSSTAVSGTLALASNVLSTSTNTLTANGTISRTTGYVDGNLAKPIGAGSSSMSYELGSNGRYAPVTVDLSGATAGALTAKTTTGEHSDVANSGVNQLKDVNRYYSLTPTSGVTPLTSYDMTMNWDALDVDGSANTASFLVKKYNGSWSAPSSSINQTGTSIKATGFTTFSDYVVGELAPPQINISGSLTPFTSIVGIPSAEQSYSVSGSFLTNDITVTPPADFELSLTSGSGFGTSPITLTQSGGSVGSTTIYVRMNRATVGTPSGNITHTSTGATQQDVAVSGTVNPQPVITVTASLTPFTSIAGTPSTEQSYTVAGADLLGNIAVTPPADFELSLTSGSGFGTSPITLTQSGGTVSTTTIYVRMNRATPGSPSGNITHTSTSATTQNVAVSGTVNPAPSITVTASLTPFTSTAGTPSAEQNYTVSGANLLGNITVTPPTDFELSLTSGSGFGTSPITLTQSGGTVSTTNIYVRMNRATPGSPSGNITHTSTSATQQDLAVSGTVNALTPTITVTASLTPFTSIAGTPSAEQSYTVSGSALTADIAVTPPTDFELSLTSGSGFGTSPITLTQSGGTVGTTTIYARMNRATAGTPSGNITHTSTGATQQDLAVSGTVNPAPSITVTASLTPFTSIAGTPSAEQSYTVSGANLLGDIAVTPPTDFELSLTSGSGFGTSPITLTQSGGTVSTTNIYVRMNRATAGTPSGNITHTSTSATTQDVAVSGTVNPAPSITVTASLTPFTSTPGVPSAEQSYTVSGANLLGDIAVTPPTDFELSLTSGSGFGTTPITLTQSGGTVATTNIYVRMNRATVGTPSGNITHVSTSATTQNLAVSGTVTLPLPTITGFVPASGHYGDPVVITGTNFTGATDVKFNATSAVTFTVDNDMQITATVPTGASTGPIHVTTANGTGTSASNFTIMFTLIVNATNGTVGKVPDQPSYAQSTVVQLTANASVGYQFSYWSGDATGNTNPLNVTMNADKNITANFTLLGGPAIGDYGSLGTGNWGTTGANWIVCAFAGTWTGATAAPGAPGTTNNVWVRNGHTVTVEASPKNCFNLTVESTALLYANATVTSPRYVRVYGTTITNSGTIGGSADALGIYVPTASQTLTLTGSGAYGVSRVQPNATGQTVIFDANVGINYAGGSGTGSTGLYANNQDNTTFTINAGKTVTTARFSYLSVSTSSGSGAGNANFILNVYGTLTAGNNAHVNLNNTAGKTTTLTVYNGGTINLGDSANIRMDISGPTYTLAVNNGGMVNGGNSSAGQFNLGQAATTIDGTVDFKGTSTSTRSLGTATINSGGKLRFADGAYPTGTVTLSSGSTVEYYGSSGITLGSTPTAYQNLLITNTAGVTLGASPSVAGTLLLQGGNIVTGANILTANGAVSRTSGFVEGNLLKPVVSGNPTVDFEIGTGSNYAPVSVAFTGVSTPGTLTAKTVGTDHPNVSTSGLDPTKSLNRYYSFTNAVTSPTNYDVTLNFVAGDVDGGATTSNFLVRKFNTGTWSTPTTANPLATSIQATGLTSFSDFAVGEQDSTAIPVVNSPIMAGATSVSGTSSEADGTTIQVYVNASPVGTPAVVGSGLWTKSGLAALVAGDQVKAKAIAPLEFESDFSNVVTVSAGVGITTTSPLPNATAGALYSQTLTASGGTPPYSNWQVTIGSLPTGLNLSLTTGEISGIPTVAGTSTFTVQVSDASLATTTKQFDLTVDPGPLDHFAIGTISTQAQGVAFNLVMTANDLNNNTVTGFTGTVTISLLTGTIAPTTSAAFIAGARTEPVTVSTAGTGLTITVDDLATHTGTSNAFNVTAPVNFRSAATGDWNVMGSWEMFDGANWIPATSTPTVIDGTIEIRSPHTITVTASVSVDELTVDAGASIMVNGSPVVFTVADGAGVDAIVNGTLKATGTPPVSPGPFSVKVSSNAVLSFGNGGIYEHNQNAGSLPDSGRTVWGTGSTCLITGVTGNAPSNANQSFYNFTWNCAGQTIAVNVAWNGTTIGGDVSVLNTNGIFFRFSNNTFGPSQSTPNIITINGNLLISGNSFVTATGSGAPNHFIRVIIGGNISSTGSATFQLGNGSGGQVTYLVLGNVTTTGVAFTTNSGAAVPDSLIFAGTGMQTFSNSLTSLSNIKIAVNSGASLSMDGANTMGTAASTTFTLFPGATFSSGHASGLNGNISVGGAVNLSTLANYGFNGAVAQATGSLLPATVNNLTINNAAGVLLDATGKVTVNGALALENGSLTTGTDTVVISSAGNVVRTNGFVNGFLQKNVAAGAGVARTFEVGSGSSYAPIGITFANVATPGNVIATTVGSDHPQIVTSGIDTAKNANRYWILSNDGVGFDNYDAVLNFVAGDLDGLANPLNFIAAKYNGAWSPLTVGTTTATSTQVTGVTSFSDFAVGEAAILTVNINVPYTTSWNMLSLPVDSPTPDDSIKNLYSGVLNDYGYAYTGVYETRYTMDRGVGYWGKFTAGGSSLITGLPIASDSMSVVAGWNMVGSISDTVPVGTITSNPSGIMTSAGFFEYGGIYALATDIVPGKAYWVKSSGTGKFYLASPVLARGTSKVSPAVEVLDVLNSVTITDAAGVSQTLYFGADANNQIQLPLYDMPPTPPAGAFDARFETRDGGSMVQTHAVRGSEGVELPIMIQSSNYPLTLTWNVKGLATYQVSDGLGGRVFSSKEMTIGGSMQITNSAVTKFVVKVIGDGTLPAEFALQQNYPNPFNPTTNIKYALPVDSKVTMEIFNMLGQRVASLVNEDIAAGYHAVEWNGTGTSGQRLASGVYFLNMSAAGTNGKKFSEVRKLMLLK